jgi:hypothetical protein
MQSNFLSINMITLDHDVLCLIGGESQDMPWGIRLNVVKPNDFH